MLHASHLKNDALNTSGCGTDLLYFSRCSLAILTAKQLMRNHKKFANIDTFLSITNHQT